MRIVSPGKNKERWLEDAIELYTTRLRGTIELECVWVRDDAALLKQARGAGSVIALDPLGKTCTSEEFSELLFAAIERGGHSTLRAGNPRGLIGHGLTFSR